MATTHTMDTRTMDTREATYTWTDRIPAGQDYNPALHDWTEAGTQPCPKCQITIILDASGSTFNFGGRGGRFCRGGSRFSDGASSGSEADGATTATDRPKTKAIIFSEMEGSITVLNRLHRQYDLTGVALNYYVFSSEVRMVHHVEHLANPKVQLEDLARNFKSVTIPYGGGTSTRAAFEAVNRNGHLTDAMIIFATDGQPGDDTSSGPNAAIGCTTVLREHANSYLIAIGAGSVATARDDDGDVPDGSDRVPYGVCRNGDYRVGDRSLLRSSAAECNTEFLAAILEAVEIGVYLPACRDRETGEYRLLNEAMDRFFECRPRFGIKLGGKMTFYDDDTCDTLDKGLAILKEIPGVGWYVITQHYQLAVETTPELKEAAIPCSGVLSDSFQTLYSRHSMDVPFGGLTLKAKVNGGYICIRQVLNS